MTLLLVGCTSGITSGTLGPGLGDECHESGCRDPYLCNHDGVCAEAGTVGTAQAGDDCSDSLECGYALDCSGANVCVEAGSAGTAAAGEGCETDTDCLAGHYCDAGTCVDAGIPFWEGGDCPADDTEGDFRVVFEIPDLPVSGSSDFFAMPFPNDHRATFGDVDLSGLPDPGETAPAVGRLAGAIEGMKGYSLDPTVYFRFSRKQDVSTLAALSDDATIFWASLDEDAADYGELPSLEFYTRTSRGRYICQNWLAVSPYPGRPLLPNHTYAVWINKFVESADGDEIFRDEDFKMVMKDERPEDLNEARAWDSFKPFRDYLDRELYEKGFIVGAAVFTTGDAHRGVRYFREVADDAATDVSVSQTVACGASSCGGACGGGTGYTELHGRARIPSFVGEDGDLVWDETSFRPIVQATDEACFALSVPEGTMPEAGWPLVVWGAEVGDTFNQFAIDGIASAMASRGIAVIAVDLPRHGARGDGDPFAEWWPLDDPLTMRGNNLQATADLHAAVRLAAEYDRDGVRFDEAHFWFAGTGEGANAGAGLLAWSMEVNGGVLANPNGFRALDFAGRRGAIDVEHGLMAAYADSALSRWHPVMSLLQQWFDPADPLIQAEGMLYTSPTKAKHVLAVYGIEDDEVPLDSIEAFLRASYLPVAGDVLADFGQSTTRLPAEENLSTDDGRRTGASVQVAAGRRPLTGETLEQAAEFIASGVAGIPLVE